MDFMGEEFHFSPRRMYRYFSVSWNLDTQRWNEEKQLVERAMPRNGVDPEITPDPIHAVFRKYRTFFFYERISIAFITPTTLWYLRKLKPCCGDVRAVSFTVTRRIVKWNDFASWVVRKKLHSHVSTSELIEPTRCAFRNRHLSQSRSISYSEPRTKSKWTNYSHKNKLCCIIVSLLKKPDKKVLLTARKHNKRKCWQTQMSRKASNAFCAINGF